LSYLNARYYNGTIGRFVTQDPVFWGNQNLADPQSLNAYSYANNNPITFSDPNGKNPVIATLLLSAIALGHAALLYGSLTNNPKLAEAGAGLIGVAVSMGGVTTSNSNPTSFAKTGNTKNSSTTKTLNTVKSSPTLPISNNNAKQSIAIPSAPEAKLSSVKVRSFGQTIYEGPRDLSKTLNDIVIGKLHDRGEFENDKKLLPQKHDSYYKEYEVPNTPNYSKSGAGPERIITGRNGEIYYTPDHYESFIKLSK